MKLYYSRQIPVVCPLFRSLNLNMPDKDPYVSDEVTIVLQKQGVYGIRHPKSNIAAFER
jgi:hypothetical protein